MRSTAAAVAAAFLFIAAGAARAQDTPPPPTCEDFRCQFQSDVDTECPCNQMDNHGRYVSCVAHIVKKLVDQGMPKNCKGKLVRCAARSVCGMQDQGFSTCTINTYGTCTNDVCDNDSSLTCTTNTDCGVVSSQCHITNHPDTCTAAGGLVDASPTCCASCSSSAP
ncbi:MAG TPA: hypothetical protein VGK20_03610 [Candidatus Binatia bacterium]|jgi:hypothetical protein